MTVTQTAGGTAAPTGADGAATALRYGAAEVAERLGLPSPTPEQVAVIEAPLEPVLVVAGAGSGKTETMTARVVHLVVNGLVEPERVLGLTFTRKAAGELGQRVRSRLRALRAAGLLRDGEDGRSTLVGPTVSTYNSYAAGLVADHAMRIGIEPASRLLGEAARWQLAADVVERWTEDLGTDYAARTVTTHVLDLAGQMAEHLVEPDQVRAHVDALVDAIEATPAGDARAAARRAVQDVRDSLALRSALVDLVVEMAGRKRAGDLIDFADQVAIAARLAREVPEVGRSERARYGVVLLDEYQDTSVAQLTLLSHLFGAVSEGAGHAVTAVGDPHQSIYGWRGASAGGLERFPEQFPTVREGGRRPAAVLGLSTSWRNDRAVLDAANTVADPLRDRAAVDLPVLSARPGAGEGEVVTAMLPTLEDEARAVAEFVRERRAALSAARGPSAGPVTAAVLCRKRSQFVAVETALRAAGLPVEVVGLGGLLTTPEVVDLVATLQAVHDPSRGDALMRLLTGPRMRLGLRDVMALGDWAEELARRDGLDRRGTADAEGDVVDDRSIVDAIDQLPSPGWRSRHGRDLSAAARARLADLAGVLRSLRGQTYLPVVDLVAHAERLLGLDIEVVAGSGRAPATARAALDAFREVAASFDDGGDVATLGAFLAWLEAAEKEERGLEAPVGEMDPGAVQVLTVHAAKGLEWDVVAVTGLVTGTFPAADRGSGWVKDHGALPAALRGDHAWLPDVELTGAADVDELHARLEAYKDAHRRHGLLEERRLAYVALTRARTHLMLSGSWWRDGKRPVEASPFLEEVAALDGVVRGEWAPDPRSPAEDGTTPTPVKPEPPATEPPTWPSATPLGPARHTRLERAAAAVRAALEVVPEDDRDGMTHSAPQGRPSAPATDLEAVAELLLAERERGTAARRAVALPPHLSASAMVRLAEDEDGFARQLRRPVPLAPSVHARRGTAFHAWLEQWFGRAALVDVDQLPGADDDSATEDAELAALQRTFLASPWASRTPVAVEVDVETPVGPVVVRSRIDAVFAEPDGRVVVVDWKTGRPPADPEARRAREVQLALYRLAWARRTGRPVDQVDAAFYYVGADVTVRPTTLLDQDGLEALVLGAPEPPASG